MFFLAILSALLGVIGLVFPPLLIPAVVLGIIVFKTIRGRVADIRQVESYQMAHAAQLRQDKAIRGWMSA